MSCENHTLKYTQRAYKRIWNGCSKATNEPAWIQQRRQANERTTSKYEIHIILCEFSNFWRKKNNKSKEKEEESCGFFASKISQKVERMNIRTWKTTTFLLCYMSFHFLFHSLVGKPQQLFSKTQYQRDADSHSGIRSSRGVSICMKTLRGISFGFWMIFLWF